MGKKQKEMLVQLRETGKVWLDTARQKEVGQSLCMRGLATIYTHRIHVTPMRFRYWIEPATN